MSYFSPKNMEVRGEGWEITPQAFPLLHAPYSMPLAPSPLFPASCTLLHVPCSLLIGVLHVALELRFEGVHDC